jgi:hypothetical protein
MTVLSAQAFHAEERQASTDVSWSSSVDGAPRVRGSLPVSLFPGWQMLTAIARGVSATVTVESR